MRARTKSFLLSSSASNAMRKSDEERQIVETPKSEIKRLDPRFGKIGYRFFYLSVAISDAPHLLADHHHTWSVANRIPQIYSADRSAFHYQNDPPRAAQRQRGTHSLCSEKPNNPQCKPVGLSEHNYVASIKN